jgi:hypothetical protein
VVLLVLIAAAAASVDAVGTPIARDIMEWNGMDGMEWNEMKCNYGG